MKNWIEDLNWVKVLFVLWVISLFILIASSIGREGVLDGIVYGLTWSIPMTFSLMAAILFFGAISSVLLVAFLALSELLLPILKMLWKWLQK